jgi:hypothetical protein
MSIPNRGPELLGVNIAFVATAAMAYSLRVFVRVKMVKAFGLDDYLMGLALVRLERLKYIWTRLICLDVHDLLHNIF